MYFSSPAKIILKNVKKTDSQEFDEFKCVKYSISRLRSNTNKLCGCNIYFGLRNESDFIMYNVYNL